MKSNPSKPKEARDSRQVGSGVALAPSHPPAASSSFQAGRSEMNKKIPNAHSAQKTRIKANLRKERKKTTEECLQYNSDASSQCNEETKPGASTMTDLHGENVFIFEDQPTTVDESNLVDGEVKDRAMLVEADLAPELISAEEVNIQAEEDMIFKKKLYQRVLWFAMVFYVFAILSYIVSLVFFLLFRPEAFGRLVNPTWSGFVGTAFSLCTATILIFIPARPCFRPSIPLEDYAPDDTQLLRDAQIASVVSLCLFTCLAIPCIYALPKIQWLGFTFLTWFFAGTVFAFSRVLLLRRSKEKRQKKSKLFWVLFVLFFLGLTGVAIWNCLNPTYPDCYVPDATLIGDGYCDGELYASEACGYDGGDCGGFLKYPACVVEYPSWIHNGYCNGGDYNTLECGYDGGDCVDENKAEYPDCSVPYPAWIGDGNCDGRLYGTLECGFDGGDCVRPGQRCRGHRECASEMCNTVTKVCDSGFVSDLYPDCSVDMPLWIGDGECDGGYYASEACGYDGGDCVELGKPCIQDEECASGFCHADTKVCYLGVLEKYPDCIVEDPRKIGNGECDNGAYVTEACGYDGGDCRNLAF